MTAPAEHRLSDEQIELKSTERARSVKFGAQYACPRCTKIDDPTGQELMLSHAYPNRLVRGAAVETGVHNRNWQAKPSSNVAAVRRPVAETSDADTNETAAKGARR